MSGVEMRSWHFTRRAAERQRVAWGLVAAYKCYAWSCQVRRARLLGWVVEFRGAVRETRNGYTGGGAK